MGELPSSTTILKLLNKPALLNWAIKITVEYIGKHLQEIQNRLTETEAIKLLNEAKNEAEKIKIEAGNIGSRVHNWIKEYLISNNVSLKPPDIEKPINAFLSWIKKNKFELIKSEHSVWSKKGYAGTLDIVCKLNNKTYIIDLKTSNGFWDEYILQIASYKYAYQEETGVKIKGMGILRLDKETGQPEFRDYTKGYNKAIKSFLHLVKYWHLQNNDKL